MPTIQSATLISLPFIAVLLDPLCFSSARRFPQEDKTLHSPFFSSLCELLQLFCGSVCHTNTHTAANKLQCHEEKAGGKMMMSWNEIPHEQACSAEGSSMVSQVPAELSVKNCSPPDPTAVPSADSVWDVLTRPRNHIKEFQRIHSKSIIQTAKLNFIISYQNLSPSYTAAKLC